VLSHKNCTRHFLFLFVTKLYKCRLSQSSASLLFGQSLFPVQKTFTAVQIITCGGKGIGKGKGKGKAVPMNIIKAKM